MDRHWEEEELEDIRDRIKDFLIDYFDGKDESEWSERLEELAHYKNWPAHAALAINDDPHCILEGLARDLVEAIAEGKVDVGALAGEVLHTLQEQAGDADNRHLPDTKDLMHPTHEPYRLALRRRLEADAFDLALFDRHVQEVSQAKMLAFILDALKDLDLSLKPASFERLCLHSDTLSGLNCLLYMFTTAAPDFKLSQAQLDTLCQSVRHASDLSLLWIRLHLGGYWELTITQEDFDALCEWPERARNVLSHLAYWPQEWLLEQAQFDTFCQAVCYPLARSLSRSF